MENLEIELNSTFKLTWQEFEGPQSGIKNGCLVEKYVPMIK